MDKGKEKESNTLFLRMSYLYYRNATVSLKHKAAFQLLLDHLMKHGCYSLVCGCMLHSENILFSFCMVYLFD